MGARVGRLSRPIERGQLHPLRTGRIFGWMALLLCAAVQAGAADLVIVNARVWTGNPAQPQAEAVAVSGQRIVAAGSNEQIRAMITAGTRVIDARGATVTPGFNDAHFHLFRFSRARPQPPVFLEFQRSREDIAYAIAKRTEQFPQGTWILGERWTDATWKGQTAVLPWLDSIAPHHPVWLLNTRQDEGVANSAALRAAGLRASSAFVKGNAMAAIEDAYAAQFREADDAELDAIMSRISAAGITSVQHSGNWGELLIFRRNRLRVRVRACPELSSWARLRDYISEYGRGDDWLRWDCLKGFGNMTAEDAWTWISGAARSQLQVEIHCFEKPGLAAILDMYRRARELVGPREPRFRIEHAHQITPEILQQYIAGHAIASVQPPLLAHFDKPGAQFPYPWRAVLDAKIPIALGTDSNAPTQLTTPLESIALALSRPAIGTPLTLDEALRAYTSDAAFAEFAEKEKGTIEAGKLADLVVLGADISRLTPAEIARTPVRMTVAGGRVVYLNTP